jgi:SOS regulatory protein LexA
MAIKDSVYLSKLQNYYAKHHSFPSYARLCSVLGLAAKSAVNKVLLRLAEQGYLKRTVDEVWVPAESFFERKLSGTPVVAGLPTFVSNVTADPFMIDQFLINNPSKTILVPVQGDSMVNAGINDGDVVVVEIGSMANTGDIVVAAIDGQFTVKTLGKKQGKAVLLAANDSYPVIRPEKSLEIIGVIVGLIRKYGK